MEFSNVVPLLYTDRLAETIDFYIKRLGFTLGDFSEEPGWASLFHGKCEIMVALPNTHIPFDKPKFTGSFYIRTKDVDRLWQKLRVSCSICYEIETFPWGMREFAVYDINGYTIQFGEEVG